MSLLFKIFRRLIVIRVILSIISTHNGHNGFVSKYAHTLLCRANLSLIVYRLCHSRNVFPGDSMRTTVKDPHPTTALSQHDGKQPAGFFFAQYVAGPLLSRGNLRSRGESGSYLNNHSVTRRLSQRGWRRKRETEGE